MQKMFGALILSVFVAGAAGAQSVSAGGCNLSRIVIPFFPGDTAWLWMACPDTSWFVAARNTDRGLQVGPAWLLRAPGTQWLPVLKTAHVAENYTPYHTGARVSDTQFCTAALCIPPLVAADLGANGFLINTSDKPSPTIAAELRDRGIAWMCKSAGKSHTRRSTEMVVWGTWDPGNYDYIIEYSFRDDGQMSFRLGATGWNNTQVGTNVAHTHDILWRVDLDLGTGLNTPYVWFHTETTLVASDWEVLFNSGFEGAMDFDPLYFASLLIQDQTVNAAGHNIGYELRPFRVGSARHFAGGEGWTLHDTWVTRHSGVEYAASVATTGWTGPDAYLLGTSANNFGVINQQPVSDEDIVLWHVSSAHHEPHDENQAPNDPTFGYKGLTLIHWGGFDLVPHNLFDTNPLGSPHRSLCDGPP